MRLVVIDAAKRVYRVFEGRVFVGEYTHDQGIQITPEEVEEIRLAPSPPMEVA